jgi:ATP-dependent 26S proteasome regulatory subunit
MSKDAVGNVGDEAERGMAAGDDAVPARTPAIGDELEVLIRARYPVIYIVSWEELRVERHLRRIADERGKRLYVWSVTSGMRRADTPPGQAKQKGLSDPVEALEQVIEHKEPAIYLFHDFHAFLRPSQQCNLANIRKMREVARALSDSYKTLVICSPLLELAPELEKDVTVVDYPLPESDEVDSLLQHICAEVTEHTSVEIRIGKADREALIRAASGLTLQEAENVFAKTLVNDGRLTADDVSTVFAEKQQIVRKSGLLEYFDPAEGLEDLGGLDMLKEWMRRRSKAFTDGARRFGLPAPKGVLLVGVQGCGKSLCAKAVSREWRMPLLRFDVGRVFSSLVGSSEENVRRAIAVAEGVAPAVLWVDEIDKAFAGTSGSAGSDGGTSARVMSTFLTWLSEKSKPVFVLATANDITQLPPELLRKGRLDEIFFVDLPDASERKLIFSIHLAKRGRKPEGFDIDALGAAAEGFSGAEIEQAVISALYDAFYLGRDIETADVLHSVGETVPLSKTMSEGISGLRSWAEGRARPASVTKVAAAATPRRKIEV